MMTLLKMAWLNVWRNKRRAVILLLSMSAGLFGVLASMGLTNGWLTQMIDGSVQTYEAHIKIMAAGYNDNPIVENSMAPPEEVLKQLAAQPDVKGVAERIAVQGLLSTAEHSLIVRIVGIEPEQEASVSIVKEAITQGEFLRSGDHLRILVGERLLKKIKRKPGNKVVLMSQQLGGEIGSSAFRIQGVFDTGNAAFDESTVYILMSDARSMLNLGDRITEITVRLNDIAQSDAVAERLRAAVRDRDVEVLTWKQRLPLVVETIKMSNNMMVPYYAIFYIAMAFGIVNTLLMAIGERTHEIGVMRAIGMSRRRLVLSIMLESMCVGWAAVVFGTAIGWGAVGWFTVHGIDLTAVAEGMAQFGVGKILYPYLRGADMFWAALATLAVSLLSSVSPSLRAARMLPVEAIRSVG